MDRGVWQARVHGVTKSWIQLSESHTHTHTQVLNHLIKQGQSTGSKFHHTQTCLF